MIPTVSKPTEPQGTEGGWNSASWVGIDSANTNDGKFSSNDVLQAGVEQRVDARGNANYTAWFEWFAPTQGKTVLGDTSPLTPSLASLNGRLYIAWKGDGNDQLNVMVSTDNGVTFHNKFISGETSPRAPALAAHNGRLFIAWKGDGNDQLNVAAVNLDGAGSPTGFSNKVVLGDTSPLSPSLASAGGTLYLAWRGDGNDQLNVMDSTDNGATFGHKFVSAETSSQAPVLGTFKGALMIGWKGDGNDQLNVARVVTNPAPTGLAGKVTLGDMSPRSPALCEFDGRLYIAWKGDGNDNLNLMSSTDGQTFADKSTSPETSPEAPSLAVDNGVLYIGWKGDGNDQLNVAPSVALLSPSYVWQTNISELPREGPGDVVNCSVQYIGVDGGPPYHLRQPDDRQAHRRDPAAAARCVVQREFGGLDHGGAGQRRTRVVAAEVYHLLVHDRDCVLRDRVRQSEEWRHLLGRASGERQHTGKDAHLDGAFRLCRPDKLYRLATLWSRQMSSRERGVQSYENLVAPPLAMSGGLSLRAARRPCTIFLSSAHLGHVYLRHKPERMPHLHRHGTTRASTARSVRGLLEVNYEGRTNDNQS